MTPEKFSTRRKLVPSKSCENQNSRKETEKIEKKEVETIDQIIKQIQNNCEVNKENIEKQVLTVIYPACKHFYILCLSFLALD